MDIARPQRTPLDIAELVEHKQRMIAGTGEVAVHMGMFEVKSNFQKFMVGSPAVISNPRSEPVSMT